MIFHLDLEVQELYCSIDFQRWKRIEHVHLMLIQYFLEKSLLVMTASRWLLHSQKYLTLTFKTCHFITCLIPVSYFRSF